MATRSFSRLLGAIFLVSGTSTGAGMLAQPVAASLIGFLPSTLMMFIAWAFMTSTALILLEVCLWMGKETHIISMANEFLGKPGKVVAWVIYLFIAYLSLTAYISGGGDILNTAFSFVFALHFPEWLRCAFFVIIFGLAIEIGNQAVGRLNSFLFACMILCYVVIVGLGMEGIETKNLLHFNFNNAYFIIPILLTSFSFQMIIPSLANYLERDRTQLRIAIVAGTSLSFIIYLLWNGIVLGHIPLEDHSHLALAYAEGRLPTHALGLAEQAWFSAMIHLFSFFAIVTSFIGISWALFDFLADGFKIEKIGFSRLKLWTWVMTPPFLLALAFPRGFIGTLEATGGYGDTILNGIIPVLMFWVGYHRLKRSTTAHRFLSNRLYLAGLLLFAATVIGLELCRKIVL